MSKEVGSVPDNLINLILFSSNPANHAEKEKERDIVWRNLTPSFVRKETMLEKLRASMECQVISLQP